MPIYEYQCGACGHRYEYLQKVDAPLIRDCPECGQPDLVKLVTAAGFRLAGSGWYETDFKTGTKRNLATTPDGQSGTAKEKAASKDNRKSETTTSGKSADSKPAASSASE